MADRLIWMEADYLKFRDAAIDQFNAMADMLNRMGERLDGQSRGSVPVNSGVEGNRATRRAQRKAATRNIIT